MRKPYTRISVVNGHVKVSLEICIIKKHQWNFKLYDSKIIIFASHFTLNDVVKADIKRLLQLLNHFLLKNFSFSGASFIIIFFCSKNVKKNSKNKSTAADGVKFSAKNSSWLLCHSLLFRTKKTYNVISMIKWKTYRIS